MEERWECVWNHYHVCIPFRLMSPVLHGNTLLGALFGNESPVYLSFMRPVPNFAVDW